MHSDSKKTERGTPKKSTFSYDRRSGLADERRMTMNRIMFLLVVCLLTCLTTEAYAQPLSPGLDMYRRRLCLQIEQAFDFSTLWSSGMLRPCLQMIDEGQCVWLKGGIPVATRRIWDLGNRADKIRLKGEIYSLWTDADAIIIKLPSKISSP